MFEKIYNFLIDYEDFLKIIFFMFVIMCLMFKLAMFYDENITRKKNIIENTKKYVIHSNCFQFKNNWYCWEE